MCFKAPGALGLGAVCCLFCWPPAPRLCVRSRLFCGSCLAVGCSLVVAAPPPPHLCLAVFLAAALCSFFFRGVPPLSLPFSGFRPWVPWALVLCAVCFVGLPLLGSPCALASFVLPACPLAASWCLLPPPPLCVSRFSSLLLGALFFFSARRRFSPPAPPPPGASVVPCAVSCWRAALPFRVPCCAVVPRLAVLWAAARCAVSVEVFVSVFCCAVGCCCVLCRVFGRVVRFGCSRCGLLPGFGLRSGVPCCAICPWVRCCAALLRVMPPGVVLLCAVLFCCAIWCHCLLCRVLWRCPSPWGPVLCSAVFCGVPSRCVLCAVCVLSWGAAARCCSPLCCVLCVSWGVALCVPCPLRSVRCCVPLSRCACVVLFVSCVLLLAPGAVVRCCVLCCFLWCSVVRCWVWWPVSVCWPCVSVSVSLSGRVVWFPLAGVVCCGALLPCVMFCGAVLSRGAVLLCSAFVLPCCLCLLCPPVACCAVLCCAVGCLCCFVPGGGVCVLWCPVPL